MSPRPDMPRAQGPLDLRRGYVAPGLVRSDRLPLGKD